MNKTINAMYFSASAKKIVYEIATKISDNIDREITINTIDFTLPGVRLKPVSFSKEDVAIIGVPVYTGRVPNVLLKYLNFLTGNGALAIPVVVYENRNYDDALKELKDILQFNGFKVIAKIATQEEIKPVSVNGNQPYRKQKPRFKSIKRSKDNSYAKFVVEPLERGYGNTLDNISTIACVQEDVTDIISDLKCLVLQGHTDEPRIIRVGSGAGDIVTGPDINISNPTLRIDTLENKVKVIVEKEGAPNAKIVYMEIEELNLSVRSYNGLKRAGVNTLEDLTHKTEDDMIEMRNLGPKSLVEVKLKLKELGLSYRLPVQVTFSASPSVTAVGNERNLFCQVTMVMHRIGVPAHIKGYQYIREAILMVVEDVSLLGAVTKGLYPGIARKYDTTSTRVERGIRCAIELAWKRGNSDTLKQIFGYSMNINPQKPTNSEFIAVLADKFRVMGLVI